VGEVWICDIGVNVGGEISKGGKFNRPVLIAKANIGGDLVGVFPMTTQYKERLKKRIIPIPNFALYGISKKSYIALNQYRCISKKRLKRKVNGLIIGGERTPEVPQKFVNELFELYISA